jgi:kynurenine formamidase
MANSIGSVKRLGQRLSNWGRWGDEDEVGTLNFVTAEKRVQAGGLIVSGKAFDLGMPFDRDGPQSESGRWNFDPIHMMSLSPTLSPDSRDGMTGADDVIIMPLQCATHWDGLGHVGYDGAYYNNVPVTAVTTRHGATRNSYSKVNDRLISRGVLLDIARLKGVDTLAESTEITADDLAAAEEDHNVRVTSGDILLVRTGWYRHFLAGDRARFIRGDEPGLGLSTLEWLHDREVAAVALDQWAVEVLPSRVEGAFVPFHLVAIRDVGLTLGEMFNLEELAVDCAGDGVYEFFFAGTGLKISNAVGSPVTPIAMK